MMLDQVDVHGADGSHGSEVAEVSTVSSTVTGAVRATLANGLATGAALVSTGMHAVAELAKTGISGKEESQETVKEADNTAENADSTKTDGLRLQFGTFHDSLADNILGDARSGVPALANGHGSGSVATEDLSAASSQAGSLVNLSPVPSESIDAKPFIPGHAEISPPEAGTATKRVSAALNVNAPSFTPGAAPLSVNGAVAAAAAPGAGAPNGAAADVMWSDVGITDETDSSHDWSQWGYADQAVWNDEYQQYGTWGLGNDGQYMWYPSQMTSNWDPAYAGGQYWNASEGYYVNGCMNGGYTANKHAAAAADGKHQNGQLAGQAGMGKRARKEKRKEGKQQSLKDTHGAVAVRSASLAVLEQQFPAYSSASLADMLAASKDDLARALDMLDALEAEQVKAPADGHKGEVLILDEENFPSLSAASSPAKPLSKRAAAAAATARPASPDTPLHTRADESTPGASRSASPAPVVPAERPAAAAEPEAAAEGEVDVQTAAPPAAEGSAASAGEEVATAEAGPVVAGGAAPQTPEAAGATEAEAPEAAPEEPSASGKNALELGESQGGAPAQPQLFAPPTPAWGRKEKPAFLLASDTDAAAHGNTHAAQAAPVDAPKRAVPITNASVARKGGRRGSAGGNATWVATGAAADAQYTEARTIARDHMRLRNQFFQQATQAYLGGDKALAKELGAKGRWHAQQMAAAHSEASDAIFRARNPSAKGSGGQLAVIDLHGQHVTEALKLLHREVTRLRGQNRQPAKAGNRTIQILVGTNHHSKGKHSPLRLPAAVEEFLKNEGIPYKKPQPGALEFSV